MSITGQTWIEISFFAFHCLLELMSSVADRRGMNIFQAEAGDVPLREPGKITVTFTPRVFPTPTRESLAPEEEAVRE